MESQEEFNLEYDYRDVMDDAYEEMHKADIEERKLKEKFRKELRPFLNTKKVWEWLNEHDSWTPEGIVSLKITYKHNGEYCRKMAHAEVYTEGFKQYRDMHHQFESKSELGVNHIFIKQYCSYEDSYNGHIAIPMSDYRYFLITYAC